MGRNKNMGSSSNKTTREITKALKDMNARVRKSVAGKVLDLSNRILRDIYDNMTDPSQPALHPFTIREKKNDMMLYETGNYVHSFVRSYKIEGDKITIFVGIPSTAKDKKGRSLVEKVAIPLEFGNTQFITDDMRDYLIDKKLLSINSTITHLNLPPRPHIRPAIQKFLGKDIKDIRTAVRTSFKSINF